MTTYHLYYLRNGLLLGSDDVEAADDDEAGRIAFERSRGRTVEVWNEHSRVAVYEAVSSRPVHSGEAAA